MFSDKIVDTDSFLDMGQGAQLLYFHLCMRADDDGFVSNPKKIMRMIGAQDDDLKVLLAKRFIIQFESGVCVIKHWLIHNLIRSDRYNETQWVKEKKLLVVDEETKKYSLIKPLATECQPNDNQVAPQVRLGKVRLGKVSTPSEPKDSQDIVKFIDLWEDINPAYRKFFANKTERGASADLIKISPLKDWEIFMPLLQKMNADQYSRGKSTKPSELLRNIGYFKAWIDQKRTPDPKRKVAIIPND